MLLARPFIRFLSSPSSVRFVTRELSSRAGRGRRPVRPVGSRTPAVSEASPPVPLKEEDAWVEVKDSASGMIYYWNKLTNETTALGAPKPTAGAPAPQQQQSGGMLSGLGGVMAEGFAFGVGSSIARNVVGSFFGGSSGSSGSSESSTGFDDEHHGDDDSWDV